MDTMSNKYWVMVTDTGMMHREGNDVLGGYRPGITGQITYYFMHF